MGDDGPGNVHALLLTARELSRVVIRAVAQADGFQGDGYSLSPLGRRQRRMWRANVEDAFREDVL